MKKHVVLVLAVVLIIGLFSSAAFAGTLYKNFNYSYNENHCQDNNIMRLNIAYYPNSPDGPYNAFTMLRIDSNDTGYWSYVYTKMTGGTESYHTGNYAFYDSSANAYFVNSGNACGTGYVNPVKIVHFGSRDPDESNSYRMTVFSNN